MRPYGQVRHGDSGCCPGHDRVPTDTYRNRRSKRARARDRARQNRRARALAKREIREARRETG